MHPSYINVLKDLTGIEARILFTFYKLHTKEGTKNIPKDQYISMVENEILGLTDGILNLDSTIITGNLQRLNLIQFVKNDNQSQASITSYAINFIRACTTNIPPA